MPKLETFTSGIEGWASMTAEQKLEALAGIDFPENVDLSRCERNTEWFAQSAKEASAETGKHMVECTLEWLREAIQ